MTEKAVFLLLALSYLMLCTQAIGQTAEEKRAKGMYFVANDAYETGHYDDALGAIQAAEEALGASNALLSALKIRTFFAQQRYGSAERELNSFYEYSSTEELSIEMSRYQINNEKKLVDALEEFLDLGKVLVDTKEVVSQKAKLINALASEETEETEEKRLFLAALGWVKSRGGSGMSFRPYIRHVRKLYSSTGRACTELITAFDLVDCDARKSTREAELARIEPIILYQSDLMTSYFANYGAYESTKDELKGLCKMFEGSQRYDRVRESGICK